MLCMMQPSPAIKRCMHKMAHFPILHDMPPQYCASDPVAARSTDQINDKLSSGEAGKGLIAPTLDPERRSPLPAQFGQFPFLCFQHLSHLSRLSLQLRPSGQPLLTPGIIDRNWARPVFR